MNAISPLTEAGESLKCDLCKWPEKEINVAADKETIELDKVAIANKRHQTSKDKKAGDRSERVQ